MPRPLIVVIAILSSVLLQHLTKSKLVGLNGGKTKMLQKIYKTASVNRETTTEFNIEQYINYTECCSNTGYKTDESGNCISICTELCWNGACTDPDICTCKPGYVHLNERTLFIPYCLENCIHGICPNPKSYTCIPDYQHILINKSQICSSSFLLVLSIILCLYLDDLFRS